MKKRAAVVGVGYLGRFHAQKYAALNMVELVGVCDYHPDTAKRVADELNVTPYTQHQDLFGKVDAVTIAVNTPHHYAIAKDFLEQGIHVLIEKPITETLPQAQELISIAKRKQLILQVGLLERFNAARLAVEPYLTTPRFIEATRLAPFNPRGSDVNVILDLMIHDIDLIQSMIASPIVSIDAQGTPVLTEHIDIATAKLHFANGAVANITASRVSSKRERKMRIFQPDSYLSIDYQEHRFTVCRKGIGQPELFPGVPNIQQETFEFPSSDAIMLETQAFVESILLNKPIAVTGEAGMKALETAIRISHLAHEHLAAFDAAIA